MKIEIENMMGIICDCDGHNWVEYYDKNYIVYTLVRGKQKLATVIDSNDTYKIHMMNLNEKSLNAITSFINNKFIQNASKVKIFIYENKIGVAGLFTW